MWAHYCDKHKGVCMKFDILADPDFFMIPFLVEYKKDYPIYNYFRYREGMAKFLLESKSIDWEYEQEIRVMKQGPDHYKFKKESLVEIIFGVRTTENDRNTIVAALAENSYINIKFSLCSISDSKFELELS
jgi:hypothetical protein